MQCPRCQHENPPQAKFCLECGARFAHRCSQCGTELPAGAKFCLECGKAVGGLTAGQDRFSSPESYTPKHLAEKILTSKSALEGERKQVTVLFADLKGSMELLADRDPEEARKILDPVLERMMEAVHRYEGTVNQVMGDGIMALFGAPLAHEDHAVRACYAALRMQDAVRRYSDDLRRAQGVEVQIRVGLNSGEVVVRSVGSDLRMDYTAVGQTTHLAARMEQMAAPGTTLITAETLRLVEGYVEASPREQVPVKGLVEPVRAHELTGARACRTRLQVAAAFGLTRLVGRDAEMGQLRRALERAASGHGQVVAVVGEPGVGKSRLFYEFIHSRDTQSSLWLEGSSVSYGRGTPYLPLTDLLKGYFQIQEGDDPRKIHEKVSGRLVALDEHLWAALSAFLFLLDVPTDEARWQALDPPQRRKEALEACRRLVLRESQVQPVLLAVENLHWVDSETQAFLDALVESLPAARVLLLVNYRAEYQHDWTRKTYYRQLQIEPLPPDGVEELLRPLLGDDPSLQALRRLLNDRTEGNPLFLEECVRALVETRVLAGERGAYRLVGDAREVQVPATVQAILAARIDRLDPGDKRLLQAASVIGKDVPFAVLQAIAGLPEDDLRRGLARLQSAEFLYEGRLFPDLEYTFKHALTHEVAYGGLVHERRRELHTRVVEAIERLYPERQNEHIESLARHALRGEQWDKAVAYLRQAAAKSRARSAHRQATAHLEQALTALSHLAQNRQAAELAVDLRLELRASFYLLGEMQKSVSVLREAEGTARALDDPRRLAWVLSYMGENLRIVGALAEAQAVLGQARQVAEATGDPSIRFTALHYLGIACHAAGDYQGAADLFRLVADAPVEEYQFLASGSTAGAHVVNLSWLARCFAELGRFEEGILEGEAGVALAERLNRPYSLVLATFGLGELYRIQGDLARAVPLLERSLMVVREWDIGLMRAQTPSRVGAVYVQSGRVEEGAALLREAVAALQARPEDTRYPKVLLLLADACLVTGDLYEARASAERALELTRAQGQRGDEAEAHHLLGAISSRPEALDLGAADGHLQAALAQASVLGMRPLVAHCHLGLGKLYRRTGKREQAQEHLATATTMYREMDMRFWLEQAETEMRERS
jgi:class 3 adenylate cyclase/tetratricopeptide (TPR) repeat protein